MSFVTISRNKAFVESVLSLDAAEIAAQEAEIARRVRQEVSKLREAAEAEARAAGEASIRIAMAPRAAALETAIAAMQEAAAQLTAPLAQKERDLAELSVELAFLLARHISLGTDVGQGGVQTLVTKLLDEAAAERGARQILRLRLNPADHLQLDGKFPPDSAQLVADEKIAPGGARVEIVTPDGDPVDKIEWDATLHGRLETIRAALGINPSLGINKEGA
jgi:flagellar biosynthesis/type III secretory pathway protein FliH